MNKAIAPNIPSLSKVIAVYVGDYYLNSAFLRRSELASVFFIGEFTLSSHVRPRRKLFATDIPTSGSFASSPCAFPHMWCRVTFSRHSMNLFGRGTKLLSKVGYRPEYFANIQTDLLKWC